MKYSSVREVFLDLDRQGLLDFSSLQGCSNEEISKVEANFGCELPFSYREFLTIAGKKAGLLFAGTDIFYPGLLMLNSHADELLDELGLQGLFPANAKVFCMHQGYEVDFFLPGSAGPLIFQFVEGQTCITQPWEGFLSFLVQSVDAHLQIWSSLN